jgi:flagella basal body P-ring formation protein FlgA
MMQRHCFLASGGRAAGALLLLLSARAADAATLRPMTTLDAPVVRLSDLFDDAGPLAARVLGPAPPPGERIVVGARQLAAIARMFGVAWQPQTPADSAVLERPGRLLPREVVLGVLRPALAGVGAPADGAIAMPSFVAPMIPLHAQPVANIEQLDYDAATGGFAAAVLVTGEGMAPLRLRLSGTIEDMALVLVPVRALSPGSVLRASDVTPLRVRRRTLHGEVAQELSQIVGRTLRRPAAAGAPVLLADLAAAGSVEKGAHVVMQVELGGLTAATQGIALSAAAPGERVQVLNPLSRMVVEGEVLPSGVVSVTPGSLPVAAGAPAIVQAAMP